MTEPNQRSDLALLQTLMDRAGDEYKLEDVLANGTPHGHTQIGFQDADGSRGIAMIVDVGMLGFALYFDKEGNYLGADAPEWY